MKNFRPISISLSPNVEKDDIKLALNLIIRPWLWKGGDAIEKLENEFKKYLGVKHAVSFNSGRSSLYAILETFNFPEGSEILIQAFTCNAVPNPIIWAGLKPVYVDCNEEDFNMSADDLRQKITVKAKAVIVQHNFGMPADIDRIRAVCAEFNLLLIEDCAHSLGAEYNGVKVGTQSRASFFSFSRDKIISSVYGGMAATNDDVLAEKLRVLQKEFSQPSRFWVVQQLLHPIILNYFVLPFYGLFSLGKIFLVVSQMIHILSKAVSLKEKEGEKPDYFPKALPNSLATLALNQLNKLEKFNKKRLETADYYYKTLSNSDLILPKKFENRKNVFLRFAVRSKGAHETIFEAWHKENILLGDWYTTPIAPFDTKPEKVGYDEGSCKNAEYLAKHTFNLPTNINLSQKDVQRVASFIKKRYEKRYK